MLTFATDLGTCGLRWSAAGLTDVYTPTAAGLRGTPLGDAGELPSFVMVAVDGIVALMAGEHRDLRDVVLDWSAIDDPFRRGVLEATRLVGPGELATYGEIARAIGTTPGAARAVGRALGSNPWPIVVPCHRVVAADGALTGFSAPGGITTKRRMLEIERAPGYTQQALFA